MPMGDQSQLAPRSSARTDRAWAKSAPKVRENPRIQPRPDIGAVWLPGESRPGASPGFGASAARTTKPTRAVSCRRRLAPREDEKRIQEGE